MEDKSAIVVSDFDSAMDAIISQITHENRKIEFAEKDIRIKITGEQWDGKIDYKIAEFISRLQREVISIYNLYNEEKIKYNTSKVDACGLRVTVEVKEGCTELVVPVFELLKKMNPDQIFDICITGLILYFSSKIAISYFNNKKEREKAEFDYKVEIERIREESKLKILQQTDNNEIQKKALEINEQLIGALDRSNQHMSYISGKMNKNDKMEIDGVTLSAQEAKSIYKKLPTSEEYCNESRYFIDGNYVVTTIKTEKDIAVIRINDKLRPFSLIWLENSERENFYRMCGAPKREGAIQPIPLRLTAILKNGSFLQGFVAGIGTPREGAKTLNEAIVEAFYKEEADSEQDILE